jgi:hypothetical protein
MPSVMGKQWVSNAIKDENGIFSFPTNYPHAVEKIRRVPFSFPFWGINDVLFSPNYMNISVLSV